MNRRGFLSGLVGLAAASSLPWRPTPELVATPALPIPAAALAYDVDVYLNGMLLRKGFDYEVIPNSDVIDFKLHPGPQDVISVIGHSKREHHKTATRKCVLQNRDV